MQLSTAFRAPVSTMPSYLGVERDPWSNYRPPTTALRPRSPSVTYPARRPPSSLLVAVRNMKARRRAGQRIEPAQVRALMIRLRREAPAMHAEVISRTMRKTPFARAALMTQGLAGLGDSSSIFDNVLDNIGKVADIWDNVKDATTGPIRPRPTAPNKLGTGNANSPGAQARPKPPPRAAGSGSWMPMVGMAAALTALVMWSK